MIDTTDRSAVHERDPGAFYDRLIWVLIVTGVIAGLAYAVGILQQLADSDVKNSGELIAALVLGEASILAATAFTVAPLHFFRYMSRKTAHIADVLHHIAGADAPAEVRYSPAVADTMDPEEVEGVDGDGARVRFRLFGTSVRVRWLNPDGSPSQRWGVEKVRDFLDVQFAEETATLTLRTKHSALRFVADDHEAAKALADKIDSLRKGRR